MQSDQLEDIRRELREIREMLRSPASQPDDLVEASYIAARTGLAERTILEGKAGTRHIPRIRLKNPGSKRPLIRFQRAAVDRWIRNLATEALANQTDQRVRGIHLVRRKRTGTK